MLPLWGLTLLSLSFWGGYNAIQGRAWYPNAVRSEAQADGSFADLASRAAPLPPVFLDNDSLYWLRLATDRLSGGPWRPRRIAADNVPLGRPNHWSSPWVWLMAGTARLAALFTGRPAAQLLDVTAPWINPGLFALLLVAVATLLGRRLPPWTAGWLVLSLATLPPVMRSFSVLHVDHHGLIDIPAVLMVLCLLLGLSDPAPDGAARPAGSATPARGWFLAAGIWGGLGLWFQASHQLILIAGVLGAFLSWSLFARPASSAADRSKTPEPLDPAAWRIWAVSGALVSLAAYFLEYAPGHLGLRLEVNHPLYALCWWGGTEAALAFAAWRRTGRWRRSGLAIMAAGCLPALAVLGLMETAPERWFTVATPFLQRIHSQIGEFKPLLATARGANPLILLILFNSLPLLALYGLGLALGKTVSARNKLPLVVAWGGLLPPLALCLRHNRYSSLLGTALWCAAAAAFLVLPRAAPSRKRLWTSAVLAAGAAASLWFVLSPLRDSRRPFMPVERWAAQMVQRDVAREIAALPDFPGSRALCGYNVAPPLEAFAQAQTTGGLYWENLDGLRATADFFVATDDAEAVRMLRERGIRWIVLEDAPNAASGWLYYRYGAASPANPRATLAARLAADDRIPAWLERIPADRLPLATRARYRVFRVR